MRLVRLVLMVWAVSALVPAHAQAALDTCRVSSSYDVSVRPQGLLFDRPQASPTRIELTDGQLRLDGSPMRLTLEDQDRLSLFERQLRQLVPQVKDVARQGVDLAVRAVHEETGGLSLSPDTRAEMDRRLAMRATELKQRIQASTSTHDWGDTQLQQLGEQIQSDLGPLLTADLGQQALNDAMSGDLQAAAALRDQAAGLVATLQPRLLQRMQALRPRIQALCPAIQRLVALQQEVQVNGRALNLLQKDR